MFHATSPRVLLQQVSKAKEKAKKAEAKVAKATGISLVEMVKPRAMATMAIPGTQDGSRIRSSTVIRIQTTIGVKAAKAKGGRYVQAFRSTAVSQTSIRDGTRTRPNCGCESSRNQAKPIGVPWESRGRAGKPRQLRTLQTYMRCVYKKM